MTTQTVTEKEETTRIYQLIKKYPGSDAAIAYRMGRKDMNTELSQTIEKLSYLRK